MPNKAITVWWDWQKSRYTRMNAGQEERDEQIRSSKQVWKTPEIVREPRRERVNATWTDHREQTEVENTFRRKAMWAETFKKKLNKKKQRASWILPPASHVYRSEHDKITRKHKSHFVEFLHCGIFYIFLCVMWKIWLLFEL